MTSFFSEDQAYCTQRDDLLTRPIIKADDVRDLRQYYKRLVGGGLYSCLSQHNLLESYIQNNFASVINSAAQHNIIFQHSSGMVACFLREVNVRNCIKFPASPDHSKAKQDIAKWYRVAEREARELRKLYARLQKHDPTYDAQEKYREIHYALTLIRISLSVGYFNKLPTNISDGEYNRLSAIRPDCAKKRYRHSLNGDGYIRIGGFRRRPALILFGPDGVSVLLQKTINRYEKAFCRFFKALP